MHGLFGLSQGSPLPIANHPGWTVEQKNGCQLVKKDGKLSNFEDPESGMTVPSVVQSDGRATDVRYENGRQVTTHVTVHDVLSREATENRAFAADGPIAFRTASRQPFFPVIRFGRKGRGTIRPRPSGRRPHPQRSGEPMRPLA